MKNKNRSFSLLGFLLVALLYLGINGLMVTPDSEERLTESHTTVSMEHSQVQQDRAYNQIEHGKVTQASVHRVVDGDTIVAVIDGEHIKVRLSGIDTPESVGDYEDNPEYYGQEASVYAKELMDGKVVWLEEDKKPYDRYDRYLAYVWLVHPAQGVFEEDCVNGILVLEGYASWFDDWDNRRYAEILESMEAKARQKEIGLWGR